MKFATNALAVLFAATAALAVPAQAVEDTKASAQEPATAAPVAKKKVKPHSHLEDRGLAASSGKSAEPPAEGDAAKTGSSKKITRHHHPRDAK